MNVYELIPPAILADALEQGHVRRQIHPTLPYAILNYTERATYDGVWNEATLNCRGLIVDETDGMVVARPFPKFFNYGQPGAPDLDLDAWASVTEKMDGSLGILYPIPCDDCGGRGWLAYGLPDPEQVPCERCHARGVASYAIATRGSFSSDQALHATILWAHRYRDVWEPPAGVTCLFEIIYPENRIVCDYGDTDDLFLLEMIDIETGEPVVYKEGSSDVWPGPTVETHPYRTLAEALAADPRPGKEGLVVSVITGGPPIRVKIKQADYVALHRIVTGLNKRTVWEHMGAGKPLDELVAPLPDEFRPWVEDVAAELSALVANQAREIEEEYQRICLELNFGGVVYPGGETDDLENGWRTASGPAARKWERKDFALLAKESPWSWALFLRLDGRDFGPKLWKHAKPEAVGPAGRVYTEDAA